MSQWFRFAPAFLAACLACGCGRQSGTPPSSGKDSAAAKEAAAKKPHAFRGKIEKIDPAGKMITVDGEDVQGWMSAMTMVYRVDKPEVLSQLAVGDKITATVYDNDFGTLYDIKPRQAEPSK